MSLPPLHWVMRFNSFLVFFVSTVFWCLRAEEYVYSINVDDLLFSELFFEIIHPEELRYTFKIQIAKNFGSVFNDTFKNIGLVPTFPPKGCGMSQNSQELRDKVALVERGECSFLSKAVQAEKAGAVAVIIMDSDIENDHSFIDMLDDDTKRDVFIPAVFLLGKNGFIIRKTLERKGLRQAIINIPVNLTGVPYHKHKQPPWIVW